MLLRFPMQGIPCGVSTFTSCKDKIRLKKGALDVLCYKIKVQKFVQNRKFQTSVISILTSFTEHRIANCKGKLHLDSNAFELHSPAFLTVGVFIQHFINYSLIPNNFTSLVLAFCKFCPLSTIFSEVVNIKPLRQKISSSQVHHL